MELLLFYFTSSLSFISFHSFFFLSSFIFTCSNLFSCHGFNFARRNRAQQVRVEKRLKRFGNTLECRKEVRKEKKKRSGFLDQKRKSHTPTHIHTHTHTQHTHTNTHFFFSFFLCFCIFLPFSIINKHTHTHTHTHAYYLGSLNGNFLCKRLSDLGEPGLGVRDQTLRLLNVLLVCECVFNVVEICNVKKSTIKLATPFAFGAYIYIRCYLSFLLLFFFIYLIFFNPTTKFYLRIVSALKNLKEERREMQPCGTYFHLLMCVHRKKKDGRAFFFSARFFFKYLDKM